jgi:hypothetical protein
VTEDLWYGEEAQSGMVDLKVIVVVVVVVV